MVTLALRNIFRNLRRSLLSALAIAVSVMSIILLLALIDGMEADMRSNLITYYTGEIRVRSGEYQRYERFNPLHLSLDATLATESLSTVSGISAIEGRIAFPVSIYREERSRPAQAIGLDFSLGTTFIDFDSILSAGRLPEPKEHAVLIGSALAQAAGLSLGDRVTLLTQTARGSTNAITFVVVGVVSPPIGQLSASTLYLSLDVAQHFLLMEGQVQELLIHSDSQTDLQALARTIGHHLESELELSIESKAFTQINELYGFLSVARLVYWIIALVFFILGSTVIINTTMMVIYERMGEIGMMKALGMYDGQVASLFLLEAVFISSAGSMVGAGVGSIITCILQRVGIDFTEALSGIEMEISSRLYPKLTVAVVLGVLVYGIVTATLSTLIPSRKAAKIHVVEALHYV
jgi:putative ABC transport system permease protein